MSTRTLLVLLAAVGVVTPIVGCGGSGGSNQPTTTTPVHFSIAWGARSRAIQGPSSALSATVTLDDAGVHGGDVVASVNRNAAPAAYTQSYTSSTPAKTGTFSMTVRFYDRENATGNVVGLGSANVTIAPDGTGIGDITVVNTVDGVTVDAEQVVPFEDTKQLTFTARDENNAIVAVTPGSATWTQVDGSQALTLTADGVAQGVAPGTSHVRVTVDGKTSASTPITVSSPPDFQDPGFETVPLTAGQWLQNGDITGTPWSGDANWGIANASGAWGIGGRQSSQYAFLQVHDGSNPISHGAIRQTVNGLVVGRNYRVSMWIARRNGNVGGNVGALVRVLANGEQIMEPTSPLDTGGYRQVRSNTFVATQTSYQFTIQAVMPQFTEDQATLIDEVHLERAP